VCGHARAEFRQIPVEACRKPVVAHVHAQGEVWRACWSWGPEYSGWGGGGGFQPGAHLGTDFGGVAAAPIGQGGFPARADALLQSIGGGALDGQAGGRSGGQPGEASGARFQLAHIGGVTVGTIHGPCPI
jgi:hypothetical protein